MFIDLLNKALEKDTEDKLWEKWLMQFPQMEKKMDFAEFRDRHFKPSVETELSDEKILEDAENILKMMSRPK